LEVGGLRNVGSGRGSKTNDFHFSLFPPLNFGTRTKCAHIATITFLHLQQTEITSSCSSGSSRCLSAVPNFRNPGDIYRERAKAFVQSLLAATPEQVREPKGADGGRWGSASSSTCFGGGGASDEGDTFHPQFADHMPTL
jgi:hypothetical protein